MFDIESILAKADLFELVKHAGSEPDNHGRCTCPLHGGHDPNAFEIYTKDGKQLWNCFSGPCGGGDAISFVMAWQGFDFKRACEFLGGDVTSDPQEMHRLADLRHMQALKELEEAHLREEARRSELQQAAKHLIYHETMKQWAVDMWTMRGVDECWQGLWYLGACDDKVIISKGAEYHTPTLTIPIFAQDYKVLNIKHRLISPPEKNDKYRPETSGLGTFPPFLAFPEHGYDGKTVYVIEGEIKAMVCATITDDSDNQFIGIPGKSHYKKIVDNLKGKNVVTIPDPGAESEAMEFCRITGSRYLPVIGKIDDIIIEYGYDGDWLKSASRQARRVK